MVTVGVGVAVGHRVGVGFPEGVKLLHFYTEFPGTSNFYTFTLLAHFFCARCARVTFSRKVAFQLENENRKTKCGRWCANCYPRLCIKILITVRLL